MSTRIERRHTRGLAERLAEYNIAIARLNPISIETMSYISSAASIYLVRYWMGYPIDHDAILRGALNGSAIGTAAGSAVENITGSRVLRAIAETGTAVITTYVSASYYSAYTDKPIER